MTDTGERGGIGQRIVDDYAGHKLYDERGEKVGKVEYTVLDAEGRPEYIAVKTGWFGSNTTLIPEGLLRPGERDKEFEVQASEDRIKEAPTFDNEDDVNRDFEDRVREYFGIAGSAGASSTAASSGSERRDDDGGRERGDEPRSESRSDRDDRDRGAESRDGRDRDDRDRDGRDHGDRGVRSESRDDFDRDSRDARDEDRRSSDTRSDTGGAAAAGGAAAGGAAGGSMARDDDRGERRDEHRDDDRGGDDRRDDRSSSGSSSSGSSSGGEREKVRVTVKRERARAERIRGEDGKEEVRIRKEMIEEEEMVEVEDRI
ncbi:MAG: PRC-barrel domain-containing protein [Rubrobacteraceae bacterium]